MSKVNKVEQAQKLLTVNPNIRVADLSKRLGVTKPYAYTLVAKAKKLLANEYVVDHVLPEPDLFSTYDPVNNPTHYTKGGIETIDFIEAKGLDYHLGNVIKYITRADHKDNKLEDLRKAQWYLTRAIERIKG
jgi:hypothetical protein